MSLIPFQKSKVVPIFINYKFHTTIDVLRLDEIHPVVSGNKWFKLKNYLFEAIANNKKTILTFGGTYSNHIVATAAASQYYKLKSIGIIRGERPKILSHTLQQALSYDMELYFISRNDYKEKVIPGEVLSTLDPNTVYIVNEGGYGKMGMLGAMEILEELNSNDYSHIIAAVGTGTMLSGIISAAHPDQKIIGIPVLKDDSLELKIKALLPMERQRFQLIFDYHFGGYAKTSPELIQFMNNWYNQNGIPTDFVYTGKLFFAANDLLGKDFFPKGSKILIIHSGGLQGNLSLPQGTLIF
jgi:1-aminocyclopropane-1-carboxylate deaminase